MRRATGRTIGRGVAALALLLAPGAAWALLPEPPNLIHGVVRSNGALAGEGVVSLVLEGAGGAVATHDLAGNATVDGRYLLEVPLDALDPRRAGAARPGDRAEVFVGASLVARTVIGQRGRVLLLDLTTGGGLPDADGDGVPDVNDAFAADPAASVDTDGDGHPDAWNPGKTQADSTTGLVIDAYPENPGLWATFPVAVLSGAPPASTPATGTTIQVAGAGVAAYRYRLDAGAWSTETPVSTPITLTGLAPGAHLLEVLGKGTGGAWQPGTSPTTAAWTVQSVTGFPGAGALLLLLSH